MNSMTTSRWYKGCLITAALTIAPMAFAGPSPASPEMQTAFAKAAQGPDQLRRYVERTKPIYMLDYNEVMSLVHPEQTASAQRNVVVANNATQ